jgi:hypothetical protein
MKKITLPVQIEKMVVTKFYFLIHLIQETQNLVFIYGKLY